LRAEIVTVSAKPAPSPGIPLAMVGGRMWL
jgi:hypothetical protein